MAHLSKVGQIWYLRYRDDAGRWQKKSLKTRSKAVAAEIGCKQQSLDKFMREGVGGVVMVSNLDHFIQRMNLIDQAPACVLADQLRGMAAVLESEDIENSVKRDVLRLFIDNWMDIGRAVGRVFGKDAEHN